MLLGRFIFIWTSSKRNPSVKISIRFSSNSLHFFQKKRSMMPKISLSLSLSLTHTHTWTHKHKYTHTNTNAHTRAHSLSLGLSFVYFDDNNFKKLEWVILRLFFSLVSASDMPRRTPCWTLRLLVSQQIAEC